MVKHHAHLYHTLDKPEISDEAYDSLVLELQQIEEKYPELKEKSVKELIKDLSNVPEDIRTAVRNNGGGHINHSFFWTILKKVKTNI